MFVNAHKVVHADWPMAPLSRVQTEVVVRNKQRDSGSAFLTWDFFLRIKGREYKIHGSTHLKFNKKNRIVYHRDYWDVGEEILLKIPFIKFVYSYIQKKMALPQEN